MTRTKALKRAVRDRMAETGEAYTAARSQLLQRPSGHRVAVTNGDSVAGTLREAGLAAHVIPWRDVLHDGPVPNLPPARLRKLRAAHLSRRFGSSQSTVESQLRERDSALAREAASELTLWFEADLYDQLQLIQVLDRLRGLRPERKRISMIAISDHPDRPRFGGLGELTGDQLAALLPLARPVTQAGLDLAARAWAAFTAPAPEDLIALVGVIHPELRYLGDALRRLIQEYPSTGDGLSLTQRRILTAVDRGLDTLPKILRAHWETEARPFLGDLGCAAEIATLAGARRPALAETGGQHRLTDFGHRLLAGAEDWVEANGIDRWIGGVHLGATPSWRYDERRESLVPG